MQGFPNALEPLSLFEKSEKIEGDDLKKPHQLAYWPIIPGSDRVWIDGVLKSRDADYTVDYGSGQIYLKVDVAPEAIIRIDYQIIPVSVQRTYRRQLFAPEEAPPSEQEEPGEKIPERVDQRAAPPAALNFSGTKTLSLSMESIRGLTINQPTRLNVSGKVSENVSVMAMLSDQDLPLQPEGTTEEIEDLDRILIKIQGKHLSATLGDYEAAFGETEFVLLPRPLEGAQAQGEFDVGGFTLLGAVARGQTSSITQQGVEGQNEYRITADGRYVVMIAGSETVWLNGEKMRRGEENDYVIRDYGDPTVEFTNKHLITGNDVIVVDFEYIEEDRNYRQDLYGTRGKVNLWRRLKMQEERDRNVPPIGEPFSGSESGVLSLGSSRGLTLGVSYATESDDKDNPLIPLREEEIASLKLNDLDPDGDGILLPAPRGKSVLGFDSRLSLGESTSLKGEIALGKRDLNTFSSFDELEESRAWKLNGSSGTGKLNIDFDFRRLDPQFVPIGATVSSRTRATYQEEYDDVAFGETLTGAQTTPPGEASYDLDLWYEPVEHVRLSADLGRISYETQDSRLRTQDLRLKTQGESFSGLESRVLGLESSEASGLESRVLGLESSFVSERVINHWSRSLKIDLPDLPHLSTRYQEAVTEVNGEDDMRNTRDSWELEHRLWEKLNIGARSEEIESLMNQATTDTESRDRRREERRFTLDVPELRTISLSGEYSLETEYIGSITNTQHPESSIQNPASRTWLESSSAHTISANLFAKPKSWLDFSGYFARRKFSRLMDLEAAGDTMPADSTTNLADLKLNLKPLRINYQIDKKLSTEREEQYVNYVLTRVDDTEEKRFLKPGEGSYVKIDEFTFREDMEDGDYIRLVRTVRDRPVTSVTLQSVFSLRPRSSFRTRSRQTDAAERPPDHSGVLSPLTRGSVSAFKRLTGAFSILETGIRISEEQESASRDFYFLQDLQTDNTIYGLRRYWARTQISPVRQFSLIANWEAGRTLNKRINSRSRDFQSDRWSVRFESPIVAKFALGGEWAQDDSSETVSSLSADATGVVSDISEKQRSRSLFLRYNSAERLSRLKLEGVYDTERDDDALSDEPPVLTRTISLGAEATWSFRGKGTTITKYEIARGTSSGTLPFARYDFHEGISHRIRLETNYRLKWFTDLTARLIYRAEIAEREKPDHRLEMEMTANF